MLNSSWITKQVIKGLPEEQQEELRPLIITELEKKAKNLLGGPS
jgi:hypothetical protein